MIELHGSTVLYTGDKIKIEESVGDGVQGVGQSTDRPLGCSTDQAAIIGSLCDV